MKVRTMARVKNKVVLVTGAARGIGAAIARSFADEGASVVVSDLDEAAGRATAGRLRAGWVRLDVREELAWIGAVAQLLDRHGRIDALVNSAGVGGRVAGAAHDPEQVSLEDWHTVHRTHLDGVFLGCKHAIRAMRRSGGGAIVNVVAGPAHLDAHAAAACASSQAAVRRHTKTVALYCAAQRLAIRCNSIHRAAVLTRMGEPTIGQRADREERLAALAVLLASDEAAQVTGVGFGVDGGPGAGSAARLHAAGAET